MRTLLHSCYGRRLALPLCCLVAAFACRVAEAQPAKPKIISVKSPPIERLLHIVEFDAPSVGRSMKYMALLPKNYDTSNKRYPTLYLLHGFSQNYTVWPRMGVPQYTDDLDLIVIMPDAGNSWYINWAKSENGQANNWEDYIVKDILGHVDSVFRTDPRREARAVSGLSMGGYGAVMIGLRHPDLFCSIGAHSATLKYANNALARISSGEPPLSRTEPPELDNPLDRNIPEAIAIEGFTTQPERYPLGTPFLTVEDCRKYDPYSLVLAMPREQVPHIYLDCGLGDNLITDAVDFLQLLLANGIEFTYGQSPGEHRPSYWTKAVAQSIAVQYSIMQRYLPVENPDESPAP